MLKIINIYYAYIMYNNINCILYSIELLTLYMITDIFLLSKVQGGGNQWVGVGYWAV